MARHKKLANEDGEQTGGVIEASKACCASATPPSETIVNWRERIKPEYLVVNKEHKDRLEKAFGKPLNEIPLEKIGDESKLILLGGIKDIAQQKGYRAIDYHIITDTPDYVTIKCTILWKDGVSTAGCANANPQNSDSFWHNLLVTCAENRAFVRCVRNHLGIHITGKDETSEESRAASARPKSASIDPIDLLRVKVEQKGKTFDQFREWYSKYSEGATKWQSYADIPVGEIYKALVQMKGT